jgi:hypothetical protein
MEQLSDSSKNISPVDRFFSKISIDKSSGCINWTGCTWRGYGIFNCGNHRTKPAHRFAYETIIGPIPNDLTLDHLCRNRKCINPFHLEPVSRGENVMRGDTIAAANKRKIACLRGHLYATHGFINTTGHRQCKICVGVSHRAANKRYYHRNRAVLNGARENVFSRNSSTALPRRRVRPRSLVQRDSTETG